MGNRNHPENFGHFDQLGARGRGKQRKAFRTYYGTREYDCCPRCGTPDSCEFHGFVAPDLARSNENAARCRGEKQFEDLRERLDAATLSSDWVRIGSIASALGVMAEGGGRVPGRGGATPREVP